MYRHTNSHAGAHSVLVKFSAAFGHVNDLFLKTVMPRTGCLFEHDAAARLVLSNGAIALSGSGSGRSLRHLRPRERCRQPYCHAQYSFFHITLLFTVVIVL